MGRRRIENLSAEKRVKHEEEKQIIAMSKERVAELLHRRGPMSACEIAAALGFPCESLGPDGQTHITREYQLLLHALGYLQGNARAKNHLSVAVDRGSPLGRETYKLFLTSDASALEAAGQISFPYQDSPLSIDKLRAIQVRLDSK